MPSKERWARLAHHVETCESCGEGAQTLNPSLCWVGESLLALFQTERLLEGLPEVTMPDLYARFDLAVRVPRAKVA